MAVDDALGLHGLLSNDSEADEVQALNDLTHESWSTATVADFAGDLETMGKVTVTTYHSAKGREWPYVILPALQEGIMPDWPLDYGRPYSPSAQLVAEERRLFYVALTRAKIAAVLLHTPSACPPSKATHHGSPSRFIRNLPGFDAASRRTPGSPASP